MASKKRKWLGYAIVVTAVTVILLLVFAVNSEPLVQWFKKDMRSITWEDILGMSLISLFILALLVSHLTLVIVAARSLSKKPHAPPIKPPTLCPQCGRGVHSDWLLCPYCGHLLRHS